MVLINLIRVTSPGVQAGSTAHGPRRRALDFCENSPINATTPVIILYNASSLP